MTAKAWSSKIPEITRRMEGDATRSGLKAAGEVLLAALRERLESGFTTGDFSTGRLAREAVKRTRPSPRRVIVTTSNPVLIAWTLGHHNIFTQAYERVDHFTAALEAEADAIAGAFAARYKEKLLELVRRAAKR